MKETERYQRHYTRAPDLWPGYSYFKASYEGQSSRSCVVEAEKSTHFRGRDQFSLKVYPLESFYNYLICESTAYIRIQLVLRLLLSTMILSLLMLLARCSLLQALYASKIHATESCRLQVVAGVSVFISYGVVAELNLVHDPTI